MTPEQERAVSDFAKASADVRKANTMNHGGAKAEKAYSDSYEKLVSLGLRPKLRARYRY